MRICDAHVHVGRFYRMDNPDGFVRSEYYYAPTVIAEVLKTCGVDEFIFSSITCQHAVPLSVIEDEARETQRAFGPGAHPFLWLTGAFFDDDRNLRMLDNPLWEGVKIHELETPWVKKRPQDLDRILSIIEERGLPVQFHSGEDEGCFPRDLLPFAKRHPRLRIDFAHCRPHREMIDCLKQCPNLFTDTAFMPAEYYPELVAAGVEHQVMFGTDLPIQGGFYEWKSQDTRSALMQFYKEELAAVQAVGYSDGVMALNLKTFLHSSKRKEITNG